MFNDVNDSLPTYNLRCLLLLQERHQQVHSKHQHVVAGYRSHTDADGEHYKWDDNIVIRAAGPHKVIGWMPLPVKSIKKPTVALVPGTTYGLD